jgi:hypothetical protein
MDILAIAKEYDYRIEAGSARKPNKQTRIEQMQSALQNLGPVLSGLIGSGVVDPFNALIRDWAESMDLDATPYLVPPPPPPMPPPMAMPPGPAGEGPPSGEPAPPPDGAPQEGLPQIPQELMP